MTRARRPFLVTLVRGGLLAAGLSCVLPGALGAQTVLTSGVAKTGLGGSLNAKTMYSIAVPSGAAQLVVAMFGGTGDADLYVRVGSQPTLTTYNCRPFALGNTETCTFPSPAAGTWHVMIHGATSYSGASLRATVTTSSTGTFKIGLETSTGASYSDQFTGIQLWDITTNTNVTSGSVGSIEGSGSSATLTGGGGSYNFGTRAFRSYRIDVYQGGLLIGQKTISFTSSMSNVVQDVALYPKRTLTVTARYSNGTTALPNYFVTVFDAGGVERGSSQTNSSGAATFSLFPSEYSNGNRYRVEVRATSSGSAVHATPQTVDVLDQSSATTKTITTTVAPSGTFRIALESSTGASYSDPFTGVQLWDLTTNTNVTPGSVGTIEGSGSSATLTGGGGSYNLGSRPFRNYRIDVYQGGLLIGQETISFSATMSGVAQDVSLFPMRTLRVTAFYSNGTTALPGHVVKVFDAGGVERASGQTNSSGQASMLVFPSEYSNNLYRVEVRATSSGSAVHATPQTVNVLDQSTATTKTITTTVNATGVFQVALRLSTGGGYSDDFTGVQLWDVAANDNVTDGSIGPLTGSGDGRTLGGGGGSFNFGQRSFKHYRIDVYQGGLLIGQGTIDFTAGKAGVAQDVVLYQKRTLTVTATYANGTTPLSGYFVKAFDAGGVERGSAQTGSNGQASFQLFPSEHSGGNTYRVEVRPTSSGTAVHALPSTIDVLDRTSATTKSITTTVAASRSIAVALPSGFNEWPVEVQLLTSSAAFVDKMTATSSAGVTFGSVEFGEYRLQIWRGALVIGEMPVTVGPTTSMPIVVSPYAKRSLTIQTYYAGTGDRLLKQAGNVVQVFDGTLPRASANPVATATTDANGKAVVSVYPTEGTASRPADVYYLRLLSAQGQEIGNTGTSGVGVALDGQQSVAKVYSTLQAPIAIVRGRLFRNRSLFPFNEPVAGELGNGLTGYTWRADFPGVKDTAWLKFDVENPTTSSRDVTVAVTTTLTPSGRTYAQSKTISLAGGESSLVTVDFTTPFAKGPDDQLIPAGTTGHANVQIRLLAGTSTLSDVTYSFEFRDGCNSRINTLMPGPGSGAGAQSSPAFHVILVHGFSAFNDQCADIIGQDLAADYWGFGKSDPPAWRALEDRIVGRGGKLWMFRWNTYWSMAAAGNALADLIDGLPPGPVYIVGHSFGGVVSVQAATHLSSSRRASLRKVITLASPHEGTDFGAATESYAGFESKSGLYNRALSDLVKQSDYRWLRVVGASSDEHPAGNDGDGVVNLQSQLGWNHYGAGGSHIVRYPLRAPPTGQPQAADFAFPGYCHGVIAYKYHVSEFGSDYQCTLSQLPAIVNQGEDPLGDVLAAELDLSAPTAALTSFTTSTMSVTLGQPLTITLVGKNTGNGSANTAGYMGIGFRQLNGIGDASQVAVATKTNGGTTQSYAAGSTINNANGSITAQYLLSEYTRHGWPAGEENTYAVTWTPTAPGTYVIEGKVALQIDGAARFSFAPGAGPTDQQGERVQQLTVTVLGPPVAQLSSFDVSAETITIGQSVDITLTGKNIGTGPTNSEGYLSIGFRSLTAPADASQVIVKSSTPGGSVQQYTAGNTTVHDVNGAATTTAYLLTEFSKAAWPAGEQNSLVLTWTPTAPGEYIVEGGMALQIDGALGHSRAPASGTTNQQGALVQPKLITVVASPVIKIDPASRDFAATLDGPNPPAQTVALSNLSGGSLAGLQIDAPVYEGGHTGWLSATLEGTTVTISVTTGGLPAGTHTASISVRATGADPKSIGVSFTVSGVEPSPIISLNPTTLAFEVTAGASPASRSAQITNTGGGTLSNIGTGSITYSANASGWLAASLDGTLITTTVTSAGLAAGTYTATVPVTASNALTQSLSVTLEVSPTTAATLVLNPAALVFSAAAGSTTQSQTVGVLTAEGQAPRNLATGAPNYAVGHPTGWLSAAVSGANIEVTADPTALAPGAYSATVAVSADGATTQPLTISIVVSAASGIGLSAIEAEFIAQQGTNPPSQQIQIVSLDGTTLTDVGIGTITYAPGQPRDWLNIGVSGMVASLAPQTGSLAPGVYDLTVTIVGGGDEKSIAIRFTVTAAPQIVASPASVAFLAQLGSTTPSSRSVTLGNVAGGTLEGLQVGPPVYSATQPTGWLVANLSGTTLTLSATIGSLPVGSYEATVSLTATNAASGIVTVTLSVREKVPPVIAIGSDVVAREVQPTTKLAVPILVDLSKVDSQNLSALSLSTTWAPTQLVFDSLRAGSFGALSFNAANVASGGLSVALFSPSGTTINFTVATLFFTAAAPGTTRLEFNVGAARNHDGESIMSFIRTRALDVCVAWAGKYGDANGDGSVNIIDAQQVARHSVGLDVGNPTALQRLGDVNADGSVNILDAQQIARFAIGLSAASRIGQDVAVPPDVAAITVDGTPSSPMVGGSVQLSVTPRNAAAVSIAGCAPITWASSDPSIATVDANGLVTGVSAGSVTITATARGASVNVGMVVGAEPVAR